MGTTSFQPTRRAVLRGGAAGVTAAAVGGLAPLVTGRRAHALDRLTTFRSTSKSWLWAPEDYAIAKGLFEQAGLLVEASATQRGVNTDALLGGAVDIVLGTPDNTMRLQMQGQPVKMIAGFVDKFASHIVVKREILERRGVAESSPVADKSMALKGLKLGTTGPGAGPDVLFRYLLTGVGLEPDRDAQLVRIQGGGQGMLAALSQGVIDGFCLSSPTSDLAVAKFGAAYLFDMAVNPPPELRDYLYTVASTSERTIAAKRPQLVAYIRAMAHSLRIIREQQASFHLWAKEFFEDLDPAVFERAFASNVRIYMESPLVTEQQFRLNRRLVDIGLRALGGETLPESLSFERAWDLSMAKEAMQPL